MRRRDFLTLVGGGVAAWPVAARAQQQRGGIRVGVLMGYSENNETGRRYLRTFRDALSKLGWDNDRIVIDVRWGDTPDQIRASVAELVARRPDIIVASSAQVVSALHKAGATAPIVFANVPDPVGIGLVQSFAKPGGNTTGFANFEQSLASKWLEIIREVLPRATRIGVAYSPPNPAWRGRLGVMEASAGPLGLKLAPAATNDTAEIERVFAEFAHDAIDGVVVLPSIFATVHRKSLVAAAARHRVPAVYPFREFAVDGGLLSYGIDALDEYRGVAAYVDRILRGEKAGNLPVQLPTRFELVINLRAARELGLTVPPTFLARADEVIE